jgi:hypothetical protein
MASYQMTFEFLEKNLRNVGAMLFDHDSREAIKRMKARALKETIFDRQMLHLQEKKHIQPIK